MHYFLLLRNVAYVKVLAALLLVSLLCIPCYAQVVPNREEWLARDPRLAQTVTVTRYHIRIGELMDEASQQTGVAMSANSLDGADSEVITVYARKIALVDLLANVWSLMSYQQAAWRWEVEGDGKKTPYSYKLNYPQNAKDLPLAIADEVNHYFEESLEVVVGAIDASPKEREALGEKYPEVMLLNQPLENKKMKALRSVTTKEERAKFARGEMEKSIPSSEWTPEIKEYVDATINLRMTQEAKYGRTYNRPYPGKIALSFSKSENRLTPSLGIDVERSNIWTISGGIQMDDYWRAKLEDLWIMEGDSHRDSKNEAVIIPPAPVEIKHSYRSVYDNPQQDLINNFNKLTGISFFARGGDLEIFPYYEKSTAQFLESLRRMAQSVKWRNGAMLVAPTVWVRRIIASAERQAPWPVMRRFRQAVVNRPDYNCTLEDLAALAHDLTPKQIEALGKSEEMFPPNLFIPTWGFFDQIREWRPVFSPLARNKELLGLLQTEKGVRIRELPQDMRDYLAPKFPNQKISPDIRLRIRTYDIPLEEWKVLAKKQNQEGDAIPRAFYIETIENGEVNILAEICWSWRRPSELNTNRTQPDMDMRPPFFQMDRAQ